MPTISFEHNVVVRDPKKIKEIQQAIKKGATAFLDVKPHTGNHEKDVELLKSILEEK